MACCIQKADKIINGRYDLVLEPAEIIGILAKAIDGFPEAQQYLKSGIKNQFEKLLKERLDEKYDDVNRSI